MKPKNLILTVAITAFLFSCNKNVVDSEKSLTSNAIEATSKETVIQLRQSYALLTPNEKGSVWEHKFNAILKNDAGKLTVEQLNIIKEIKTFLSKNPIESLIKKPWIGEEFLQANLSNLERNFSNEQLYLLVECPYYEDNFSLSKAADYLNTLTRNEKKYRPVNNPINNIIIDPDPPKCSCYWSISCGLGNTCDEKKDACYKVQECGMFGTSNCNGKCSNETLPQS